MFGSRSYFRVFSTLTILLNLIVGICAISLVERIVPAIDEILRENSVTVAAAASMHEAVLLSQQEKFDKALTFAQTNVTIDSEKEHLTEIASLGKDYWSGNLDKRPQLSEKITELSSINLKKMNEKEDKARLLGLSGAWALGFLIVVAIVLQLILRARIIDSQMEPISELLSVLRDYSEGNSLRRFRNSNAGNEIQKGGQMLNDILDRDMTR
jgi:methyl-accepting chemotaxis protein